MKTKASTAFFLYCLLSGAAFLSAQIRDLRLTLLYDNTTTRADLTADWGFSCLVRSDGETILFDTGAKPVVVRSNMRSLGIDQSILGAIAFSHEHTDHVLGVSAFGGASIPAIYLPKLARIYDATSAAMRDAAADIVIVSDQTEIAPSIWLSEPLGGICFEQALAIDTAEGLVVVVGCSHPGIVAMLRNIAARTGRPLHALVGGMHLMDSSADEIRRVISELRAMGLQRVCPCHCSGEKAIELFRSAFPDGFLDGGVGAEIRFGGSPDE
jgi:7,8-dihydropterin-6-yl-methyl-4-(beta-D-ribofuranosyl)aminobenzene 5'-phosphate synthase